MAGRRGNAAVASSNINGFNGGNRSNSRSSLQRPQQHTGSNGNRSSSNSGNGNNNNPLVSFNPKLILSQMTALQCGHYLFVLMLIQINHVFFATSITVDRLFTCHYLNIWTAEGWIDNSAVLLSAVSNAVLLAVIVEKAKKCLDFSFTLFMIHTIACTVYDGLPSTWDWWIVHILHMIIMIVLGEYFCSRREMRDIPLLSL